MEKVVVRKAFQMRTQFHWIALTQKKHEFNERERRKKKRTKRIITHSCSSVKSLSRIRGSSKPIECDNSKLTTVDILWTRHATDKHFTTTCRTKCVYCRISFRKLTTKQFSQIYFYQHRMLMCRFMGGCITICVFVFVFVLCLLSLCIFMCETSSSLSILYDGTFLAYIHSNKERHELSLTLSHFILLSLLLGYFIILSHSQQHRTSSITIVIKLYACVLCVY